MSFLRKLASMALAAVLCAQLCACSALENEYVVIEDYKPSVQEESRADGKIIVKNYSALMNALLRLAYEGQTEGSIVFDAAYEGDTTADMASACWTVRTQDALCAYCVENIAYELNKIVTINEATVYLSYSDVTVNPTEIHYTPFSYGAEAILKKSLTEGSKKVALLVERSGYSSEDMAGVISDVYREYPTIVPREPSVSVNMYSGSGTQRLYEISINYGLSEDVMNERKAQLAAFAPFSQTELNGLDEMQKAYMASDYLLKNCSISDSNTDNTAYAALVQKKANSEGLAFAFVELCRQLGLDCCIVYGQFDWQEHCWNIIKVDGNYYHVDVSACISFGPEGNVLANDEQFWGLYRWDVASYPKCSTAIDTSVILQ